jgi:hypothetical protein
MNKLRAGKGERMRTLAVAARVAAMRFADAAAQQQLVVRLRIEFLTSGL